MKLSNIFRFIILLLLGQPFILTAQISDTINFSALLELAMENNFGIRITKSNIEINSLNNTYGNAGFLPVVGINVVDNNSVTDSKTTNFRDSVTTKNGVNTNMLDAYVQLNWTLFDGTKMFVTKKRLNEMEKRGTIQLQLETERVYVQLALVYYALVQQQKLYEVLKYSQGISRFRLNLAEKKFKLGAASEIDRIQASLDFSNDSSQLINEETKIVNLKAEINRLVGRSPDVTFSVGTEIKLDSELKYPELESSLQEQNRQLLLAKSNLQIKELELKELRSNFLPALSLYSDYEYLRNDYSTGSFKINQNVGPTVGFRLGYNVFNGFNDSRKRQIGKIAFQSAQLEVESELNTIKADLYQNYNDYTSAIKQVALESENLENARKNFQFAIEMYKQGSIDEIDFREIQRKEYDAESRLLYAQYNAKMAEIQLLQISGGLKF